MPGERMTTESPATRLREARVGEAMSRPLVTCGPDMPIAEVAELMSRHHIHSVVVLEDPARSAAGPEAWGVISDLDLMGAAAVDDGTTTAGRVAASPRVVVEDADSLARASLLMAEHATSHLLVCDGGRPEGVVSALDVAGALAPPPEETPPHRPAQLGLRARPGDRLVITAHGMDEQPRDAEVLEARGPRGGPPFLVRWESDGRVSLHYPGSDARIERTARSR